MISLRNPVKFQVRPRGIEWFPPRRLETSDEEPASQVVPGIPVVRVDTGYLPAETYRFAAELTERLARNIHATEAKLSPARMEALYGRLWEGSSEDLETYHRLRKVEPLERALRKLDATALISGVRADQTDQRATLPRVGLHNRRAKVLPRLGWTSRDVHGYLKEHGLPYHPFFEQGYASVGDWHSSRPVSAADDHERDGRFPPPTTTSATAVSAADDHERDGRFDGRAQERGIHVELSPEAMASLEASGL